MYSGANSSSLQALQGVLVAGLEGGGQAGENLWPCLSSVPSGSCTFQGWLAQIRAQIPQLEGEQQKITQAGLGGM